LEINKMPNCPSIDPSRVEPDGKRLQATHATLDQWLFEVKQEVQQLKLGLATARVEIATKNGIINELTERIGKLEQQKSHESQAVQSGKPSYSD
jgi:hypothetical protein